MPLPDEEHQDIVRDRDRDARLHRRAAPTRRAAHTRPGCRQDPRRRSSPEVSLHGHVADHACAVPFSCGRPAGGPIVALATKGATMGQIRYGAKREQRSRGARGTKAEIWSHAVTALVRDGSQVDRRGAATPSQEPGPEPLARMRSGRRDARPPAPPAFGDRLVRGARRATATRRRVPDLHADDDGAIRCDRRTHTYGEPKRSPTSRHARR